MKIPILLTLTLLAAGSASAQYTFRAIVKSHESQERLTGVTAGNKHGLGSASNDSGLVVITGLAAGTDTFTFSYVGYKTAAVIATLPADTVYQVALYSEDALEEVTIVSSTRTNDRIESSPVKVEVLGAEEMGEENTIKPANIASILGDVSGVQIQQSSAVSGNSNVRIQGLNGQYTQLLRDGMPLYDGLSGGFGILQVPPLDLRQVELIKGSASTLYGGGAIAGLINLISRRPASDQEGVITLNATTLGEQNANAYIGKRYGHIGYTLFAGYTHQQAVDVDGDGFSDVPDMNSVTLHPRLFWYPDSKTTLIVGYNATFEKRNGGDMQVITHAADSVHRFFEQNNTQRHSGEIIFERTLPHNIRLTAKGTASRFHRDMLSNTSTVKAAQLNYYSEVSLAVPLKANMLVAGINTTGDDFSTAPGSDSIALHSFSNNTIGAFAQYSWHITGHTTLEAGLRGDHTRSWGNFVLPRIALFHRFSSAWAARAGAGFGYKTPNALAVQVIDYPVDSLQPLPAGIRAETSYGYNLEGNFKKEFNKNVNLFVNHAFFLTQIASPVIATQLADGRVIFGNAARPINTMGFDTYVKLTVHELELYFGYTYTDARRQYLAAHQFMPLTPRNRFAFTAVRAFASRWRIGLEGSFIGTEYRDADANTHPYFLTALVIERKLGRMFTVVLNGENLLDYRQTSYERIYTGGISAPVFRPLWAPVDGRVINLSVRITPFAKAKE